jgi:hypothetical protein
MQSAVVVHTYNPSTWEVRQKDQELQVSLGYYTVRPCLKKNQTNKVNTIPAKRALKLI